VPCLTARGPSQPASTMPPRVLQQATREYLTYEKQNHAETQDAQQACISLALAPHGHTHTHIAPQVRFDMGDIAAQHMPHAFMEGTRSAVFVRGVAP